MFLYWDIIPQDDTHERNKIIQEEVEEDVEENAESKPLVGPHELTGSYGTVTSVQIRATRVSPPPTPPPEEVKTSPFKNFSASRGERG